MSFDELGCSRQSDEPECVFSSAEKVVAKEETSQGPLKASNATSLGKSVGIHRRLRGQESLRIRLDDRGA